MKKELLGIFITVILVFTINNARAATIVFENSDFGETLNAHTAIGTFTNPAFDIGDNYVRGNINALAGDNRPSSDYGDWWSIFIPFGQQITSIDITITNLVGSGIRAFTNSYVNDCCPAGDMIVGAYTQANIDGTYALTTTDPFGGIFSEGDFPFQYDRYFFGVTVPGVNASEFSYEWKITVENTSPVPLPAAIWLFSIGLLSLFGISRRNILHP